MKYFRSFDGVKIRYGSFGDKNSGKTVVLLPGRAEYIEKYHQIIKFFCDKGCRVFSMDWRGQGGSGRMLEDIDKGYVSDFNDYVMDLRLFLDEVVYKESNSSVYAVAHSMGGHILLRLLLEYPEERIEKFIFSSPMLGINTSPFPVKIAGIISSLGVKAGFGNSYLPGCGPYSEIEFKGNSLTKDNEKFMENILFLRKHRELAIGGPTYSWLYRAFISIDHIMNNLDKIKRSSDLLFIYGTDDRVVTGCDIEKAAQALQAKTLRIDKALHELMMENMRCEVMAEFESFLFT